ncbi:MAG: DUF433 domain-containing protein [Verrucomicrobia bacterium]|nr:DUF433 domain-containing protein [Verrucomicrobiota bacterium]
MEKPERITRNSEVMGGKPCIRGMRTTVGLLIGLVASGYSRAEILRLYPYLEEEDINQALAYGAWRVEELDLPLRVA